MPENGKTDFSVSAITRKGALGFLLRMTAPALDRMLGLRRIRVLFERYKLYGLEKYELLERMRSCLRIKYRLDERELAFIPATGPVVIVANHPLGGLEGMLLLSLLRKVRPDYKSFVNIMMSFVKEISDFFIFTNPMTPGSRENFASIRECGKWLEEGHCLLVFPAGRVGLYRAEKGYITDEAWDQVALSLGLKANAVFVPLFVGGECSARFSWSCRLIFPMKLLMLGWEFLDSVRKEVAFRVGRPIQSAPLYAMKRKQANAWLRMRTYLLRDAETAFPEPADISGREHDFSPLSITLSSYALDRGEREARGEKRPGPGARRRNAGLDYSTPGLHPEAKEYIDRYGLDGTELAEILSALEGRPVSRSGIPDARPGSTRPPLRPV